MRVLVIDDDNDILEFLKAFFENLGHEAVLTDNYKDALRQLVLLPPDLILLDIMLPEKDGLAILKEIKDLDKVAPVVMITAYKDADKVVEAFRLGAIDCLLKPFNLEYITNNILPKITVRPK
jgi:DNA-binding response OmpR family regulator